MNRKGLAWAVVLSSAGLLLVGGALWIAAGPRPAAVRAPSEYRQPEPYEIAQRVLDGKLAPGWEDWGWGRHDASAGKGINVDFSGYGGLTLHHDQLSLPFGALVFRFRAPESFEDFLEVALRGAKADSQALPSISVTAEAIAKLDGGWREVLLPWSALNPQQRPFGRIVIRARRSVPADWVTIDRVVLTKPGARATAARRPAALAVRCDQPAKPISPLIYGIAAGVWSTGETIHRVGGNPMSRFNWELGAWNTGSDWYFQNVRVGDGGLGQWLDEARGHGAKMAVTVPMLGWVAKDGSAVGFPVSKFGKQRSHDPKHENAGDGHTPDGKPIRPGPPSETSIPAPPGLIKTWIGKLREQDAQRGARRVHVYMLDNEPNLWNTTHRDVHPDPLTYDELLQRTIDYGSAVREADPEAVIAGPAAWGWTGYFYSAKDMAAGVWLRPDRRAHGDAPLLPWYLQRLAAHERRTKTRILDWVDVHFYPQAKGVYAEPKTDPDSAALRLRSTRALWDPHYLDESWIDERIQLIPRLRDWIAENYPGRGISIGEWSFGAPEHISGGLATAEALGRFGQQGLTAAFYWRSIEAGTPAYHAFRAFRNYDGQGAHFLDWSIPTDEAPGVSLFASRDEARSKLVLVVLNLDPNFAAEARIDVSRCGTPSARRAFAYGGGVDTLGPAALPASQPKTGVEYVLPPYSLAVVELELTGRSP